MQRKTSFKKSRNGCKRCKTRKVKCNEARPICNNCNRHGTSCVYSARLVRSSNSETGEDYSSVGDHNGAHLRQDYRESLTSESEFWNGSHESDQRRRLEVQLLHHFTTVVAHTFPSSNLRRSREIWTIDCVRVAFQYDFLLNAIFALAVLHLIRDIPDSPRFCAIERDHEDMYPTLTRPMVNFGDTTSTDAYQFYLNLAVKQQREAIADITAENMNALILSSILLSFQGLELLPGGQEKGEYSPPTQWLRMTKGISEVSYFQHSHPSVVPITDYLSLSGGEPNFLDRDALFSPKLRKPFEHLLRWPSFPEPDLTAETKTIYELILSYVGRLHSAVESGESPRVIFRLVLGFSIMTPPEFIVFVEERRPRALVILAHFFAMGKAVDDHWVFAGLADREVRGIHSILPDEYQWAMEMPLKMIED